MVLVFGGSSQGKLQFTMLTYGHTDAHVLYCDETTLSITDDHKVVYGLEKFIYNCTIHNIDPLSYLQEHIGQLGDKILICNDISGGVVPLEPQDRKWREYNGRCLQYLAEQSKTVYRVFCGLPMVLKDEEEH